MKKIVFFLVALLMLAAPVSAGDDYDIRWSSPVMRGKTLKLSGRVSGLECKRLTVKVFLKSETGWTASITCVAKNVEPHGTRRLEGTDVGYIDKGKEWEITSVYTSCQ